MHLMTPEEAYEEALRRIREAENTGALELDLSGLVLDRLPPELKRLTSLQTLNLKPPRRSVGRILGPRSGRGLCPGRFRPTFRRRLQGADHPACSPI
jgi:hypothetical protein